MGRRTAALGVRPFGRLLTSYTVNEIGDAVGIVALAVLVFDETGEALPTAAFFMAAKFLPALLAPALTARLDQLPLRRTLPGLYVLEAAAFAALALIAEGSFALVPVLLLGLADGTLAITGRGLTRGAVAAVLQPRDLLREGNALLNVGFAVASVGGAALAGMLIGVFSIGTALLVDAASFVVIAVLLAASPDLPAVHSGEEPFGQRLRAGLRYARGESSARLLLIGQAIALVFFTLIVPIEVIYAKESLETTAAGYGVLLAAWGAGIVVGSVIYLRVKRRPVFTLVVVSTLAIGIAYLGLALAGSLLLACLISIVGGAGNGIQWVAVITMLQDRIPVGYQARIAGLMESIGAAMPGVGYVLGGVIVSFASPRAAYAVAGGGVLLIAAAALVVSGQFEEGERPPGAALEPRLPDALAPAPTLETGTRER